MRRVICRPDYGWKELTLILADETHKKGFKWVIDFFSSLPPWNITARMRRDVNKDRGINETDAHVGLHTC